jgi:hypothetical protein
MSLGMIRVYIGEGPAASDLNGTITQNDIIQYLASDAADSRMPGPERDVACFWRRFEIVFLPALRIIGASTALRLNLFHGVNRLASAEAHGKFPNVST